MQSNLTAGHIAAAHGPFNRTRQVAPMCTPSKTCFLGPNPVNNPNEISICSAVFAQLTVKSAYTLQWSSPPPQHCPFTWGNMDPYLIHGALGPPQLTSQTASRSVQPFSQVSRLWQSGKQTGRHHAAPSVTVGRVRSTAMWPKINDANGSIQSKHYNELSRDLKKAFRTTLRVTEYIQAGIHATCYQYQ